MFKRLNSQTDPADRPHIYSLTDLCLAAVLRMLELTLFLLLFSFAAPRLWPVLQGRVGGPVAALLTISSMALAYVLIRLPLELARSQLRNAFGLDPRAAGARFPPIIKKAALAFVVSALFGWILLLTLDRLPVLAWVLLYLAMVYLCLTVRLLWPRLGFSFYPGRYRPATDDELPDGAFKVLSALPGAGEGLPKAWVDRSFHPGLRPPFVLGGRLVIPEKALSAFPPSALKALIVRAVLSHLVRIPRNFAIYGFLSLALSAPIALILLNSLGLMVGYPIVGSPALVALFWMGAWAALCFSEFSGLLLSRTLCLKLSAATVAVTKDVHGLFESIGTLARYNLEPFSGSFFGELFRDRPFPERQIDRLKGSLMELTEEALRRGGDKAKAKAKAKPKAQGPGDGHQGPGDGAQGSNGGADGEDQGDGPGQGSPGPGPDHPGIKHN
ncbi:MAG: hypothetical protein LBF40_01420 [Deltaproteobacteria bacterium]|jgi:hypothetical protein|nr:hypothetical protein [Deltaproteobacteria bacterium]